MLYQADGSMYQDPDVIVDPMVVAAKQNWTDLGYLKEAHNNFMAAVQVAAPKEYRYNTKGEWIAAGMPRWSVTDTFDVWCYDQMPMLEWRLEDLKVKKAQNRPSDSVLIKVFDKIENPDPFMGRNMTNEEYELFEFMLRKSIEALRAYKAGVYTLEDIIKTEI